MGVDYALFNLDKKQKFEPLHHKYVAEGLCVTVEELGWDLKKDEIVFLSDDTDEFDFYNSFFKEWTIAEIGVEIRNKTCWTCRSTKPDDSLRCPNELCVCGRDCKEDLIHCCSCRRKMCECCIFSTEYAFMLHNKTTLPRGKLCNECVFDNNIYQHK